MPIEVEVKALYAVRAQSHTDTRRKNFKYYKRHSYTIWNKAMALFMMIVSSGN